jgi:serine/threonine-protein kinase
MTQVLDLLKTALAGRYSIERELGRGGMATVYLAKDLKHGRQVAIKVLHPELAASLGHERFVREIQIAAKLQHPHILPMHDSGEAGGVLYYVMPYVEGESLDSYIKRESKVPLEEALRIARQVAGALGYAHRQGIVHRDIKPANILLSDGHAIVADFGIARAISAAGGGEFTQVGIAVGTPDYMSPEQAMGESDLDGRTDIYSLGCVLHEMLSGIPPYTGMTPQRVVAKVVTGQRPKLERVPGPVRQLAARAMAPEPADRFASAEDMQRAIEASKELKHDGRRAIVTRAALVVAALSVAVAAFALLTRSPPATSVAADARAIAVLPFAATGPDVELLGEGMVDLLTNNLSGVGGIRMTDPRLVLKSWRREAESGQVSLQQALAIGRDLEAGSILTGSVVEVGDRIRLRAELHSTAGRQLGGGTVDGPVAEILSMVDSLSVRLLREIWRSSEELPDVRVSAVTSGSVEAVRAYLAGAHYARRAVWDSAISRFTAAVQQDSAFALAHILLADAYWWVDGPASHRGQEHLARAVAFQDRLPPRERLLAAAAQAFAADRLAGVDTMRLFVEEYPRDVFGWMVMGEVQYHSNDLLGLSAGELRVPFDRATTLDSTYAPAYFHVVDLALRQADRASLSRYLDRLEAQGAYPEHTRAYRLADGIVWGARDSVLARLERLVVVRPDAVLAVGMALEAAGDTDRASAVYARGVELIRDLAPESEALAEQLAARLATLEPEGADVLP